MTADDDLGLPVEQGLDRGEAGGDSEIVRNLPLIERYVQVRTQQDGGSFDPERVESWQSVHRSLLPAQP